MPSYFRLVPGILLLVLITGCAWKHQDALLKLDPQIAPSSAGNGASLALRVLDKRPTVILGYRGMDSKGAEISTEQDLPALFEEKLLEGLARKGFNPQRAGDPSVPLVTVEILKIEYSTAMDFWKGSVNVVAVLRVFTSKNGLHFDQSYTATQNERSTEAPSAKRNNAIINAALSSVVQRVFEDERLMIFLAH